jgi:hypothetical protein
MPHSRHIDADGILITTMSGVVPLKEVIEIQNEIPGYARDNEFYELVLRPDDVDMALDSNESIASADNVKRVLKELRKAAIAFVSNKDYIFGLCRQLEIRVENEYIQMCVFRTKETALQWLHEMKSSNKAEEANG